MAVGRSEAPVISSKIRRMVVAAKRFSSRGALGSPRAGMSAFRHSCWYLSGVCRSKFCVRLRCFEEAARMAKYKAGDVAAAWTTTVEKCLSLSIKSNYTQVNLWSSSLLWLHTHKASSVEKWRSSMASSFVDTGQRGPFELNDGEESPSPGATASGEKYSENLRGDSSGVYKPSGVL